MKECNIAEGYDLYTGNVDINTPSNNKYGEIHTGDDWLPDRFCGGPDEHNSVMPAAIVIFGDKSHTDLHGALSLTPVIFTLTLFNRISRNNPKFWQPLGYIPNLGYGKNKADKTETKNKIQDEHKCLACILKSIRNIHRSGGFNATVLGKAVQIKVWIHFFIGDTEGNNKWVGHFPGNKREVKRPYRDCRCSFGDLSNPNPTCVLSTLEEMEIAKRRKKNNEADGLLLYKSMSRYVIKNALTQKHMPLSDNIHGPANMTPPELLHASGSGVCKYIFESLGAQIGGGIARDDIDKMHIKVYLNIKRQSERDFPRGAIRSGIIDSTKCQSEEERKGNLFLLLCIANMKEGSQKLRTKLSYSDSKWTKWLEFVKLYLSMEEWFHDSNDKEEVPQARPLIAKVLKRLQWLFPRDPNSNGWNIPKIHAMTKFQTYIMRYGSAINFYGGTGESAHKIFVKAPGLKTQRRVSEFAVQTARQYYVMLVTSGALQSIEENESTMTVTNNILYGETNNDDNVSVGLSGRYSIHLTDNLIEDMRNGNNIHASWHSDPKRRRSNNLNFCLDKDLVRVILSKIEENEGEWFRKGCTVDGYTRLTTTAHDGIRVIFYAHPFFQGRRWYDWVYVHFEEINATGHTVENFYPAKILGFITMNNITEAVIQCSVKPLIWTDL